eukprot:Sdes_comp18934_c0_seq2m9419
MNSTLTAFALTFIAGLSTGLGGLLTLLLGKFYKDFPAHLLGFLLSFSSGVMIFISIFDLMLEAIYELDFLHWLIYTALGSGGFALFLRFIPNDEQFLALGLHSSSSKQGTRSKKPSKIDAAIIRTALVTSLGVSAHNLPEGIAVYFSALKGLHLGIPMTVAIAMHNIPGKSRSLFTCPHLVSDFDAVQIRLRTCVAFLRGNLCSCPPLFRNSRLENRPQNLDSFRPL